MALYNRLEFAMAVWQNFKKFKQWEYFHKALY